MEEKLLSYVQYRFLLEEKPVVTDSIYELAELSLASMAKLSAKELCEMERIGGCTGARSGMETFGRSAGTGSSSCLIWGNCHAKRYQK